MKNRYLLIAQDFMWLADLKEQAHALRSRPTIEENAAWAATMTGRFPAPWRIVEIPHGYAVGDATGQQLAVFYGLAEPNAAGQTDLLTIDEARQMALDFAKLPALAGLQLAEMPAAAPKFTSFEPVEHMRAALLPRPSDPLSNGTKFLIAIAVTALPAGYFIFRNFDRPADVAAVPQAATDIPRVEFSPTREAEAPSTKGTGIAVEGAAEPEVQTKGKGIAAEGPVEPEVQTAPPPVDSKSAERDIQARPPRTPEKTVAASRDDSTCLPSASAVRQNHPGAWPSWTLRAPGHENTICWYASTRTTAHHN
jgi:hypothetical protein